MRIGVYGSAISIMDENAKEKAKETGRAIAKRNAVLVTGGCTGLPYEAVLGAGELDGKCIAFSPATNLKSHRKLHYPTEGFSEFVFVPPDYMHAENIPVCKKYRNVMSVAFVDATIFIGGSIGTMNEFTIAYGTGKTIGVLENTGGITKRAIKTLLEDIDRKTGAEVVFESNPDKLIEIICRKIRKSLKGKSKNPD